MRARVTTADERVNVGGISITVPSGAGSCSAHLINHGVTVEGNSATVEFDAVGLDGEGSFRCRHINQQDQPEPCVFI